MGEPNLTVEKMSEQSAEVMVSGCKVRLHFAPIAPENTLGKIQNLLLGSLTHVSAYEKKC